MELDGQEKIIVIKIGGSTLGSHDTTIEDLVELQRLGKRVVVVHGGGKIISEWVTKQGVSAEFVRGERVTDKPTLDVVMAILAGLVNKEIVAAINDLGGRAVGLSGVDGRIIQGRIKSAQMGYVGVVTGIDATLLNSLLEMKFIPVIAPIALNVEAKENEAKSLNVNADTVAGDIATAIEADKLVFLTDVDGVRDASGNLLPYLSSVEAEALVSAGVATGGMVPKINACLEAVNHNTHTCIIDSRKPHVLLDYVDGRESGTIINRP